MLNFLVCHTKPELPLPVNTWGVIFPILCQASLERRATYFTCSGGTPLYASSSLFELLLERGGGRKEGAESLMREELAGDECDRQGQR